MKEHRDPINRLSIFLDDNAQLFEVYAARLEKDLKARPVMKIGPDMISGTGLMNWKG